MHNFRMPILVLLIAGALAGSPTVAAEDSPQRIESHANWVSKAYTVSDQTAAADLIVRVRVQSVRTAREIPLLPGSQPAGGKITKLPFTESALEILEVFKGSAPKEITVLQTGGRTSGVDSRLIEVGDDPLFVAGEEAFLFLKDISGDPVHAKSRRLYRIVNPASRYRIEEGNVVSRHEFPSAFSPPATVTALLADLRSALGPGSPRTPKVQ